MRRLPLALASMPGPLLRPAPPGSRVGHDPRGADPPPPGPPAGM